MTVEQLERGRQIQNEIQGLKKELVNIQGMLNRNPDCLDIGVNSNSIYIRLYDKELAEQVLYTAKWSYKAKIDRLEREFAKL